MSFSLEVKNELINYRENTRHCNIAELAAIVNLNGEYSLEKGTEFLIISAENEGILKKTADIICFLFGKKYPIDVIENKKQRLYQIGIVDSDIAHKILSVTGVSDTDLEREEYPISPVVVSSTCCKRAYIRGAFICTGSISNPEKHYHMEFVNADYYHAANLKEIITSFAMEPKIVERKNHYIVYIKEGEQIVDMLNIMSAHRALLELENIRIVKDVRNNVNRIVNCETANLNKVVSASVRQREAIEYIKMRVGLGYLSQPLEDVAIARLEYPELSLLELGKKLNPPVGKSGVNHRLKKICEIADFLKGEF